MTEETSFIKDLEASLSLDEIHPQTRKVLLELTATNPAFFNVPSHVSRAQEDHSSPDQLYLHLEHSVNNTIVVVFIPLTAPLGDIYVCPTKKGVKGRCYHNVDLSCFELHYASHVIETIYNYVKTSCLGGSNEA